MELICSFFQVSFCRKTNVPILGVVENMAKFVCPNCSHTTLLFPSSTGGAETMCKEGGLDLLTQLPLEPALAEVRIFPFFLIFENS